MANNSTPRLKVYRLENTYTQEGDNDIQQLSNDELLPVVVKNINPFDSEEMVGVRARQDARLVVVDSTWSSCSLAVGIAGNHIETTDPVCCEGWVLGKGNIEVFAWRGGSPVGTFDATVASIADNVDYSELPTNQWTQLDRRFWDIDVETKKTYVIDGEGSFSERLSLQKPSSGSYEIHDLDWITFRLGNMLVESDRFFTSSNSMLPIATSGDGECSGAIAVRYRKYHELSSGDSSLSASTAGVPFGDVYNGNKNGRCIWRVVKPENPKTEKANTLETDDEIDNTKMNFYEGNYLFRRRLYPLRAKVIHEGVYDDSVLVENTGISSEFAYDALMYNGRAVVHSELSWFMDDIMKPVVFERISVDGRKVFRQLSKKQVTVQYQNTVAEGDHYIVTLNPSYYSTGVGNEHVYPKELFLVYNYVDDSLGNAFDFDYDYMQWDGNYPNPSKIGYGYANTGRLSSVPSSPFTVSLRREKIAMLEAAGRDPSTDLLLVNDGNSVSFVIPYDSTTLAGAFSYGSDAVENMEKQRINNGIVNLDIGKGIRIYVDGKVICTLGESENAVSDVSINGVNGYGVSYSSQSHSVAISHSDESAIAEITEVMMSYYETHPISFAEDNGVNPYCIGYRMPCYEKVKSSTLFVSSFPNWLRGHVNNDLDVFYGNKLYSGTEVKNSVERDYHDIYPEYMKDGWYAMYSEGAVEFSEARTEQNYFDVMNYAEFDTNSKPEQSDWDYVAGSEFLPNYWAAAKKLTLQYRKVRYSVAHLDGIYSVMRGRMTNYSNKNGLSRYALLEDDNFSDSVGRRWVKREDSTVRRMFEDGRDELPKVVRGSGAVATSLLTSIPLSTGQYGVVGTRSDRITTFAINGDSEVGLCFDSAPTDAEAVASPPSGHVVVRAKVYEKSLALGLETAPNVVDWVLLPDLDDAYIGNMLADGETYEGVGIESVQSNLVTIDANTKTYWNGDEMPSDQSKVHDLVQVASDEIDSVTNNYHTAPFTNGTENMLRRYRYHDDGATWGYDVFFEVLSYRYNDVRPDDEYNGPGTSTLKYVEVIAYRVLTK